MNFGFVGEILCGCWTVSTMPMGVGAGDVVWMTGFMGVIPCRWWTILMMYTGTGCEGGSK